MSARLQDPALILRTQCTLLQELAAEGFDCEEVVVRDGVDGTLVSRTVRSVVLVQSSKALQQAFCGSDGLLLETGG